LKLREITKESFLRDFFAIKGNHQIKKINKLKNKFTYNPDLEVWSDPKIVTMLEILEIWIAEADNNDYERARIASNSAIEVLRDVEWDLEYIELYTYLVYYADGYHSLYAKAINKLISEKSGQRHSVIEANLTINMMRRIVRDHHAEETRPTTNLATLKELQGVFMVNYGRLLDLSQNGTKYTFHVAAAAIRYGIIFHDLERPKKGFEILVNAQQKGIIKLMLKEVEDYKPPLWRGLEAFEDAVKFSGYESTN